MEEKKNTSPEVTVKIAGKIEEIRASMVFHSKNPRSQRYSVNLYYMKDGKEKWIQLFCQDEHMEEPAKELAIRIREGKTTDLTGYLAERRI